MQIRTFPFLATSLATGILLAACSDPRGLEALESPAATGGALPVEVSLSEIELDKVVLAAEAGGKKYFLGQDSDRKSTCLIAVPADESLWNAACSEGTEGELLRTSGPDQVPAILVADGHDTRELESAGWAKIHDNILIPESRAETAL